MTDKFRGTGRTTRQVQNAPHGAVFVALFRPNHDTLRSRPDLRVVNVSALGDRADCLRGLSAHIVVDHAVGLPSGAEWIRGA